MYKRVLSYIVVAFIAAAIGGWAQFQPFSSAPAEGQAGCQTFQQTGKSVCGKFLVYWQQHGGLAQQGYPISSEFTEVSALDGQPYTVQYFERAVFEKHPEKAAPYDVLLSQLGTFQFQAKYPGGEPVNTSPPVPVAPTATTPPGGQRCGAICIDGTRSTATGSGACSHHGGVREWLYCPTQ